MNVKSCEKMAHRFALLSTPEMLDNMTEDRIYYVDTLRRHIFFVLAYLSPKINWRLFVTSLHRASEADPEIRNRGRKGRGWCLGRGLYPLFRKCLKNLCKNTAFSCKIFIRFQMHLVNRGKAAALPFDFPLGSATAERRT